MKTSVSVSILLAACGLVVGCNTSKPIPEAPKLTSKQYDIAPPLPESVPAPAKQAVPTLNQLEFQDLELGMMIHFGPLTYSGQEKDDAITVPLSSINPVDLDTDQWVDTAVAMGAKYIVYVAKHPGGFCGWRTKTSVYSIGRTMWKSGSLDVNGDKPGMGDLLMYLHDSCKKRGLRLGILFSSDDPTQHVNARGEGDSEWRQKIYEESYTKQLSDVVRRYRPLIGVWFDGFAKPNSAELLQSAIPGGLISRNHGQNFRWSGSYDGTVPYPTWNAVSLKQGDVEATLADSDPNGLLWMPVEARISIRDTWYAHEKSDGTVKSLGTLIDAYEKSVGRGANLLVNVSPDRTGLIPKADARRAAEFGREIQKRYGKALASNPGGNYVVVEFEKPTRVGHVVIQEELSGGEKVRGYAVEAWINGEWREVAAGTAIGHKRIEKFEPVSTTQMRLRITKAIDGTRIRSFAVFAPAR